MAECAYHSININKGDAMDIYMDNAATTKVREDVIMAMKDYFNIYYANPSSSYDFSSMPKKVIEDARKYIAECVGAKAEEIFFTSGGTEADNWAIKGVCDLRNEKRKKIITTPIEHKAVLNSALFMKNYGFEVEYLPVDEYGMINIEKAEEMIDENTAVVSVMMANNEVGTIEPVKEAAEIAHRKGAYFHTDAVQAMGHVDIDVKKLGVDMLSVSGHKFGAPKGIGFLYKKEEVDILPLIHGGGQEKGFRSGTENVPYIYAMAEALKYIKKENVNSLIEKRDYFIKLIEENIQDTFLNGHRTNRLPSNINMSFMGVSGKAIVSALSSEGIYVSGQSACSSKSSKASYVLRAMGFGYERSMSAVRFTLSCDTTYEEIEYAAEKIEKIVKMLRTFGK